MTLFHGTRHNELHILDWQDICLTDEECNAAQYGDVIWSVEFADNFVIEECEGYDWDTDEAPADRREFRQSAANRGVDVLTYDDADQSGAVHTCYRVVSERALQYVAAHIVRQ